VALVVALALSNMPEALSGTAGMTNLTLPASAIAARRSPSASMSGSGAIATTSATNGAMRSDNCPGPAVHSKKSILRMKTAFIDCAEADFLFVVAICIVFS
jgi:hypothetical protein